MRYSLKSNEGENCVFMAKFGGRNPDGRQYMQDVLILANNGIDVLGRCQHINTAVKNIKSKIEKNKIMRFTGKVYGYQRFDGSKDYSVAPSKNCRPVNEEELKLYKKMWKKQRNS